MKDQKNHRPRGILFLFLSWFYTGLSPKAPGTLGSLATLPLILLLDALHFNIYSLATLILILYGLSVFVTQSVQKKFHLHDPQWIVIDEVLGMLITWSFVRKTDLLTLTVVFLLFRLFDIVKIWPASYFDKLHHGAGTITDDVISGLYAGICSLLLLKLF